VEEYFIRFLKLKLFLDDANVSLISFMDDQKTSTPSFLALDDEYLLYKLRNKKEKIRKFSGNEMTSAEKYQQANQASLDFMNILDNNKDILSNL
jgi:hypothetical protein